MPMDPSLDCLLTIRDFIRCGASRFNEAGLYFGHGTDNALDEAVQLVLHALNLEPDMPSLYLDSRLTAPERAAVLASLRRRIDERVPAAYITQRAWFAGLEFFVDEHVLVPRSPFGELIEKQLQPWVAVDAVNRVLDLCTGSGCIGLAIAAHIEHVQVDLADISEAALTVARRNIDRLDLGERARAIGSDLFDGLAGEVYDVILSNPPYVGARELASLPPEYHNEPVLGLDGGPDGLDLVRRMLRDAPDHLAPGGVIIVEVGNSADSLVRAYPDVPFTWIDFERGGDGVFLLTAQQLRDYSHLFNSEV